MLERASTVYSIRTTEVARFSYFFKRPNRIG